MRSLVFTSRLCLQVLSGRKAQEPLDTLEASCSLSEYPHPQMNKPWASQQMALGAQLNHGWGEQGPLSPCSHPGVAPVHRLCG